MKKTAEARKNGIVGRRNLPMMLLQARETLLQHFRPIFHRFGLTEQQWRILRVLSDCRQLEQHEISSLCQISGPSLSNMLSRLEEVGYVTRERSREDQRKVFVALSGQGQALVRKVAPDVDACYRELEGAVGADLMASLIVVLDRLLSLRLDSVERKPVRPNRGARS